MNRSFRHVPPLAAILLVLAIPVASAGGAPGGDASERRDVAVADASLSATNADAATTAGAPTIPASTPSADTVVAMAERAAITAPQDVPLGEGEFSLLAWALAAAAVVLVLALAGGDSRLEMGRADHPYGERPRW